jgi:hypothetical protein
VYPGLRARSERIRMVVWMSLTRMCTYYILMSEPIVYVSNTVQCRSGTRTDERWLPMGTGP